MSLPALPAAPTRSMDRDAFNAAAEAFFAALPAWATALDSALGYTTIVTLPTTSGTQWDSGLLPTTYNDLQILILGVSFTTSANLSMALGDGASSFATAQAISAGNTGASDLFYGRIAIPGYQQNGGEYEGGATPLANRSTGAPGFLGRTWRMDGGVKYLRFTGGTGDAGAILVRGKQ